MNQSAPPPPADVVAVVPAGRTVYGIQLPIQSQSRLYTAEWETRSGPAEIAQVARAAEAAGFFYVGVCDHTAIPRRLAETMGTTWYDTTATLGWLAGLTSRVRLLSHVLIVAHRHPLRTAKEMATLDLLSGGRLIIGVGAGHVPEEYETIAGDFHRRGRETDEAVSGLAMALVEEFPTLPGPRWPASTLGVAPRPLQVPRPPIWVGGSSPAALRRAAVYGDGWLPQGTPRAEMAGQIAELRRLREEHRAGAPIDIGMVVEPLYLTGPGTGGDEAWGLPPTVLSGSPDQVVASLLDVTAMGVNQLLLRFMARSVHELCDQIAAFGELVGPSIDGMELTIRR